jgi:hypothetical protein
MITIFGGVISHAIEKRAIYSAPESTVDEIRSTIENGFPWYGLSPILVVGVIILLALGGVAYSVAGKGTGSHAGREEVRRSYRRELARQMARQDADKIKKGEKVRRKWMQW